MLAKPLLLAGLPHTAVRVRSSPLVALLLALVVAGCGTPETNGLDAEEFLPRLDDLPAGFNLVPAESFPVPTSKILSDPWSVSSAGLIRRERISGYQGAYKSPQAVNIECSAALYRSGAAAREVYRLRTRSVYAFIAELGGSPLPVAEIGAETHARRFEIGHAQYLGVTWRSGAVLSACVASGFTRSPMAEILVVTRAQQARIASALGGGRR